MRLLRLFHDPATNPKSAQLVFTTHDTSLPNHLNRDEIRLTEKGDDGVTRLGALPKVDHTELSRALDLIG